VSARIVDKVEQDDQRLAQHDREPEKDVANLLALHRLRRQHGKHLRDHAAKRPELDRREADRDDELVEDRRKAVFWGSLFKKTKKNIRTRK